MLAVMATAPVPGEVKTGLCPPLDAGTAARLQESLILDAVAVVSSVPDAEYVIYYTPSGTVPFFRRIARNARGYLLQRGTSFGRRVHYCFERLCESGNAVLLTGTDSPTLPARSLELAFDALASGEAGIVFGPNDNGGCYLIGTTRQHLRSIAELQLRASERTDKTLQRAAGLGLGCHVLPEWYAIRRPADLLRLKQEIGGSPGQGRTPAETKQVLEGLVECGLL